MKKTIFLHFVQDEKFTDVIIDEFDAVDNLVYNFFVVVGSGSESSCKYISLKKKNRIVWLDAHRVRSFIKKNDVEVVVLHNVYSLHYLWILLLPLNVKVVWFAWGKDIYSTPRLKPFVPLMLYHPETKKWISQNGNKGSFFKNVVDNFFLRRVLTRIDFFSGVLPQEYALMREFNKQFRAKEVYFSYSYVSKEPVLSVSEKRCCGLNVMIGNSGDMTNNHLDVFARLSKLNLGDRKIYVPLSYGGDARYIAEVIKEGNRIWGGRFCPLTSFMPIDEYIEVLSSCGIRIFCHERQQAIGNIEIAIRSGCKVFLSETSMGYEYFESLGVKVYSIQKEMTSDKIADFMPLDEYENNVKAMLRYRSGFVAYTNLLKTINVIETTLTS